MDVSKNNGTPKSSILIGFSIVNHPFRVPLFLETPTCCYLEALIFFPPTFGLRLSAAWKRSAKTLPVYFPRIFLVTQKLQKKKTHGLFTKFRKIAQHCPRKNIYQILSRVSSCSVFVVKCSFRPEGDLPKKHGLHLHHDNPNGICVDHIWRVETPDCWESYILHLWCPNDKQVFNNKPWK